MKQRNPPSLDRLEDQAARSSKRLQSARERQALRMAQLEAERDALARQFADRALPLGRRAWTWVEERHADGSVARARRLLEGLGIYADSVVIVGPLREDGRDGHGGTGSYWVSLRLDVPGLDVSHRTGPAWGQVTRIRAAELAKVPPGVVLRLAAAVASGAAWDRVLQHLAERARDHQRRETSGVVGAAKAMANEVRRLRRASSRP